MRAERSVHSPGKLSKKRTISPDVQSTEAKCEMSVQTNIRGIEHKIFIRPDKYDADPFDEESDRGRLDKKDDDDKISIGLNGSMISYDGKHGSYKVPVINWTETPLYKYYKENPTSPNMLSPDNSRYTEDEVE